jgi:hypothetical protein
MFRDEVTVTQRGRWIRSDGLEVWAHLIDNKLPAGAIKGFNQPDRSDRPADQSRAAPASIHATLPARLAATILSATRDDPLSLTRASDDDAMLTWTGPLVVRPMEQSPPELADDDMALRFTARDIVAFGDDDSAIEGQARIINYGATSQWIALDGDEDHPVHVNSPEMGSADLRHVTYNATTHVGQATGKGRLHDGVNPDRMIAWSEQADFVLSEDQGQTSLRRVNLAGDVLATDGKSTLTGDTLDARFTPLDDGGSSLGRLIVRGNALAEAQGDKGSLSGDLIDTIFEPGKDPRNPTPVTVTAQGEVRGRQRDAELDAGFIEAHLLRAGDLPDRDEDDEEIIVTSAIARDGVHFRRERDDVTVSTDDLHADALADVVDLVGPGSSVTRGPSPIPGGQLRLDGGNNRIECFGPGTLAHRDNPELDEPTVTATWDTSLVFDDAGGSAEIVGSAVARHTPDAFSLDETHAQRIVLLFEPDESGELDGDDPTGGRQLLRVTAVGSVLEQEHGTNATVQIRRYAPGDPAQRRLERLLHLEGPSIVADNEAQTLTVPHPGMLVIEDRREPSRSDEPTDDPRGTTVFDWLGDLKMNRADGSIRMSRQVRLRHAPLDDGPVLELECEQLTAFLRELDGDAASSSEAVDASDDVRVELQSVEAAGAVYARSGADRQLIADRLAYDAATRVLDAFAAEGNVVTLYDARRATPITARRLSWNLATDRVEVVEPGPVVAPR